MQSLSVVTAAAVALALFSCGKSLAQESDGSEQEDRQLEQSIVAKTEPLDRADLQALSEISGRRLLQDATLERLMRKMSSGLNSRETRWVVSIFTNYREKRRLPGKAFYFLVDFMASAAEGSFVAADVLKTLPAGDERRSIALAGLANALSDELGDKRAKYIIAHIERFDRHGPLSRQSVAAVASIAGSTRPYSLRARAMKLIRNHETLPEERQRIYASLVRNLESDDDPSLEYALQYFYVGSSTPHPYELLVEFSSRPYQAQLIDFLARDFRQHIALAIPVLEEYSRTSEFSDSQREVLSRWAVESNSLGGLTHADSIEMRQSLFRALWPEPKPEEIGFSIAALASQQEFAQRCKTLHDVYRYYTDSVVPGSVVDTIVAGLAQVKNSELRFVAGMLILESDKESEEQRQLLLDVIAKGPKDAQLYDLLLDQYDVMGLQSFVATHARNKDLPTAFRQQAMRRLGMAADAELRLSAEAEAVLRDVVMLDDEIALGTAESALSQWGIEPPLSERARERNAIEKKANAAGVITLIFMVVAPVTFIAGFIVIPMSISPGEPAAFKKTGALLAWTIYGVAVFLLWAVALFGSYGIHGSGAPLERHPTIMAPFHVATLVGLVIVVLCIRKRARNRNEAATAPLG